MEERNGKFMSVYDLVDVALTEDPNALQRALTMMPPEKAIQFYRDECKKCEVSPVQTFIRQIVGGAAVIDFGHNYFGERGIIPVVATIHHMAVVEVRFLSCDLSSDDIGHIYKEFMSHPTLTTIDLRGNIISLPSARKLLSLAIQNRRLTSIVVDDNVPKSILIQRQCLSNANVAVHTSACVVCQKSMVHSITGNVESKVFLALEDRIGGDHLDALSAAELETILRSLLACADINDGVLFLCSQDCINTLASEIVDATRIVVREYQGVKTHHPRHPVIARCVVELLEVYAEEKLGINFVVVPAKGARDAREDDWIHCTVCGRSTVPLKDGAALAFHILCKDLTKGAVIRPSALLRLIHTLLRYSRMLPCSIKCVRHIVRFGISGFGGVIRSNPDPSDLLLSSIGVALTSTSEDDFCVVNFAELQVLDHGEEDTTCAVTVASLMSDIDGIQVDPYLIFAVGRYLAKRDTQVVGMELRHACDAVRVVGCLACDAAPFNRKNKPVRSHYVDWTKWSNTADVEKIQRLCFARRRQAVYIIDGPADNVFDRVRTALWTFREQQRCAVVVLKFCLAWIKSEKGMIPVEAPPRGGFYTTVKVIGQTKINNMYYLIIQPNFGTSVGNRGFFYISRSMFNRSVRGSPYIFIDTTAIRENQGLEPKQHFLKLVSRDVLKIIERPAAMIDVINFLGNVDFRQTEASQRKMLESVLMRMPPSILFTFSSPAINLPAQYRLARKRLLKLYQESHGGTQLAFVWNELLGSTAAKWMFLASESIKLAFRARAERSEGEGHNTEEICWKATTRDATPIDATEAVSPAPSNLSIGSHIPKPPPVTVGGKEKDTSQAPQAASSHFGRDAPAVDPMKAQIEASLRQQREDRSVIQQSKGRTASTWDPELLGCKSSCSTSAAGEIPSDEIPFDAIGARWCAVNIQDEVGNSTSETLFFIKQYVCKYDCDKRQIVSPLCLMASDPVFSRFPFATGFDCAFHLSTAGNSHAYFFSEQSWLLWDVCRNVCVQGPNTTSVHRVFKLLPSQFHQRVDSVIEVRGTTCAIFFAQFQYVVFDMSTNQPLQVITAPEANGAAPSVYAISDPLGPFRNLASTFPRGPMTAFVWTRPDPKKRMSARQLLIGFDGTVALAAVEIERSVNVSVDCMPICSSLLAGLPLTFLQETTVAAPGLFQSLLDAAPRNKLSAIERFDPLEPPVGVAMSVPAQGLSVSWAVQITSTLPSEAEGSTPIVPVTPSGDRGDSRSGRTRTPIEVRKSSPTQPAPSPPPGAVEVSEGAKSSPVPPTVEVDLRPMIRPFTDDELRSPCLLQRKVLLRQSEESLTRGAVENHRIDFDFGSVNDCAFAYLQILLDTSVIDNRVLFVAPIIVSIQCSWDAVCYGEVTVATVTSALAGVYWNATHSARYWRLVFLNDLPVGVGVVKTLWYRARWVVDSSPYQLTESFTPPAQTEVVVESEVLFRSPIDLLVDIAPQPVFTTPQADNWFNRHAILPILPTGDSCLFFCGDTFVEYDFVDEHVVTNRGVPIIHHPAFAQLPFPFTYGFDAIFYPDVRNPAQVVILHNDQLITWDIENGEALSPVQGFAESKYFKGLPFPVKRLSDVINIWDYPGHVFVFSELRVIRWNVIEACVVEGPYTREQIPVFNVPSFAAKPFLCVTSFPGDNRTFFVFCDNEVVECNVARDRKIHMKPAQEFQSCDFFSSVSRFIDWGKPIDTTVVTFDFKDSWPLVMGVTMRSSDGCNPETQWSVEFSDNNVTWSQCAIHTQSVPRSTSHWQLRDIGLTSHRFWRLTSIPGTTAGGIDRVVYSQVLFDVMPANHLSIAPTRISCTSSQCGTPLNLLSGNFAVMFPSSSSNVRNHLLLDFGGSPVELVGLAYDSDSAKPCHQWAVWYSEDGSDWSCAGTFRIRTAGCHVSWAPTYPKRYWKLELAASLDDTVFANFVLFENSAPSIVTNEGSDVKQAVGVLLPKLVGDDYVDFRAGVGRTLSIDFKANAQALVGLALANEVDSFTFMTSFEIEYSDDAADWCPVGTLVSCDDLGNAAWESEGSHRFWRLRVSRHYGAKTVRIKRIELAVCGPMLYKQHHRHLKEVEPNTYTLKGEVQAAFVGVVAMVPPRSLFVIEKDSAEGWVPITLLYNPKRDKSECRSGWPLSGLSTKWRLRNVTEGKSATDSPQRGGTPVCTNVIWQSFTGTVTAAAQLTPADFTPELVGFAENNSAALIMGCAQANSTADEATSTEGQVDTVAVVRTPLYANGATLPSLVWKFQTKRPNFVQVHLFCERVYVAPPPPPPPMPGTRYSLSVPASPTVDTQPRPITAHVEISDDGDYFVPLASATFSNEHRLVISWGKVIRSAYWRLRFEGVTSVHTLLVHNVVWLFRNGTSSFANDMDDLSLSFSFFKKWITSSAAGEAQLRALAVEGLQQADSVATGLREPEDIEEFGKMTQILQNSQKAYLKQFVRRLKENRELAAAAARGNAPNGVDVNIILDTMGNNLDPRFHELLRLINGKIIVPELKQVKDSVSWCGPKVEHKGIISVPLFNLVEIPMGLSVRWSLSPEVLLNRTACLMQSTQPAEKISVPMIVFNVVKSDWFASNCFPELPMLYEFSMSERSLIIAVSPKEVNFYPPTVNLVPPGGSPVTTKFPFSVQSGINFMAMVKLKDCLCPALAPLAGYFAPGAFDRSSFIVLTVPSLDAKEAVARFAIAGGGVNFSIPSITIPSFRFEVSLDYTSKSPRRRVSFLCEDAVLKMGGSDIPVHLTGNVSSETPSIALYARTLQGRVVDPHGLHNTELHDISFTAEIVASDTPHSFFPPNVYIAGTLCTGSGLSFPARMPLITENGRAGVIELDLKDSSFAVLVKLCAFIAKCPVKAEVWMEEVPMKVTVTLKVYSWKQCAKAVGVVSFYGQSGRITISMTATGVHMSFTLPSLKIGNLLVLGNEATNGLVLIEAAAPIDAIATIRLDGLCATLSSKPMPSQIEISSHGTLCLTNGAFFDICIRDDSLFPIGAYATVSVSRDSFVMPLSRALRATQIISTLVSHGLPFSFSVHSVSVSNCALERKGMQLTFRGVLFGYRFDVTVAITSPDNSPSMIASICEGLAAHIIEQCNESLWTSMDTFVGCVHEVGSDDDSDEDKSPKGLYVSPAKRKRKASVFFDTEYEPDPKESETAFGHSRSTMRGARAREGTFLSTWLEKECDVIDVLLADSVEVV